MLYQLNAEDDVFLVVGGLFVNHLFAKVGLFWLAGYVGKKRLKDWSILAEKPGVILLFGILIVAISGLPPFPGFWAKWKLVMILAANGLNLWIAVLLVGSLLEAAYMFRWLGVSLQPSAEADTAERRPTDLLPVAGMAVLLVISGYFAAELAGLSALWVYLPPVAGLAVYLLARLPSRAQGLITLVLVLAGGIWLVLGLSGLNYLFAVLLLAGGLVMSIGCLARTDRRPGFYPLLATMLLSLPALASATTSLEFIFIWELITLSSYFLILRRSEAAPHALKYLLFSLAAAFFLLCGFAVLQAQTNSVSLSALRLAGPDSVPVFVLLAIGLLIKAGAVGVHVWLPDAYAQADDDVSALLSAVFEHESAWLHCCRDRADEPSGLGHGAVSCGQSSLGERHLVSRRRWCDRPNRHVSTCRSGRACPLDASHIRRRGHRHCCDVGVTPACGLRRKVVAAERDDGEKLVRAGLDDAAGDFCWLPLHGTFYPGDLF